MIYFFVMISRSDFSLSCSDFDFAFVMDFILVLCRLMKGENFVEIWCTLY